MVLDSLSKEEQELLIQLALRKFPAKFGCRPLVFQDEEGEVVSEYEEEEAEDNTDSDKPSEFEDDSAGIQEAAFDQVGEGGDDEDEEIQVFSL